MTFSKWTAVAAFLMLSPMMLPMGAQAQQQQAPAPFPDMMKGTPQEQAACAPDSNRFCKQFEPDSMRVLGCLQQNRERISKSCQQVLRNRGV
jgi:hypothetical protein